MEPLRERALCSDLGDGRWGTGRRDAGWRYGESGGRRPAASRRSRRIGRKKGRCSSCRWPAPKPYQPIGSPGDTGTQRDPPAPPTLPTRAALLPFFVLRGLQRRSPQTIFPAHFTAACLSETGFGQELERTVAAKWFGGWRLMPAAGFI